MATIDDKHTPPEPASERRDALVSRLFQATLGLFDIFAVYLGDRLGLYKALAEAGPASSADLAVRTGTDHRYVREWLEQQAASGIIEVEDAKVGSETRLLASSRARRSPAGP